MKYPEYDSPFKLTMSDITMQMAQKTDEMCWNAVQRVGIDVDKEKLLIVLKQDSERYREAYAKGYDTGYEERDEKIIRCKDCKYWLPMNRFHQDYHHGRGECELNCWVKDSNWFCADGERRDDDD